MSTFVFANNAGTTLASAASSSATTFILASATNFPSSIPAGEVLAITLNDAATRQIFEVCYATAISGTSVTVTRAQEGTSAQNWGVGDFAFCGVTAGMLGNYTQGQTGIVGNARGLAGSAAGGTKTASWTAQELIAETILGGIPFRGSSLSLSFDGSGTGAGKMDAGSMPTSADLSVYAIYNPTTNTWNTLGCAGTTSNGPVYSGANMPNGYTASTLIHVSVTNSSSNILAFNQIGRQIFTAPITQATAVNNSSATSLTLATVPSAATQWRGFGRPSGSGGITVQADAAGTGQAGAWAISGDVENCAFGLVPIITPKTTFYATGNTATWDIDLTGWEF